MNIGPLTFDRPIALAPMEDVSDTAFRLICRRMGADIVYTEFTSSEAVIRDIPRAISKIRVTEEERPVAIQLFGGAQTSMEAATRKAEALGPDFIDINCGCWVKNHVSRGEGAALLKDLPHFEKIVTSTVKATRLPVTVKTRLGWDADSIVILDVAKMVEQAGAKALTVHCRTRSQAHDGRADWDWLAKIKKVIRIPLFGNGDLTCPEDIERMFQTGCDGVMIGRAAIGYPWIFKHAKDYLRTGVASEPPIPEERVRVCIEHLKLSVQMKGLRHGVIPFRKFYAGYLRGLPNGAKLRSDLMRMAEPQEIIDRLMRFTQNAPVPAAV